MIIYTFYFWKWWKYNKYYTLKDPLVLGKLAQVAQQRGLLPGGPPSMSNGVPPPPPGPGGIPLPPRCKLNGLRFDMNRETKDQRSTLQYKVSLRPPAAPLLLLPRPEECPLRPQWWGETQVPVRRIIATRISRTIGMKNSSHHSLVPSNR